MEPVNSIAKVNWNDAEQRFELRISNVLKGYSTGATQEVHDEGKALLCELAINNGYTVVNDN